MVRVRNMCFQDEAHLLNQVRANCRLARAWFLAYKQYTGIRNTYVL